MKPGEIITVPGNLILNAGSISFKIKVSNTGDRPIQVGSHYHFFESNEYLSFDRKKNYWDAFKYSFRNCSSV